MKTNKEYEELTKHKQPPKLNTKNKIQNKERKHTIEEPEQLQHTNTRTRSKHTEHKNTEQDQGCGNIHIQETKTKSTEQQRYLQCNDTKDTIVCGKITAVSALWRRAARWRRRWR